MTKNEIQEQDEGLELAKRMAEEEVGVGRRPEGFSKYVIPFVCVVWSIFQLSIASWLILDSTFIRAIHLGFALLVVFLNYPLFKKTRFGLKYFSATDTIRPQILFRHQQNSGSRFGRRNHCRFFRPLYRY